MTDGKPCPDETVFDPLHRQHPLVSLADPWGWGAAGRDRMEYLLGCFPVVAIHDPAVLEAYAVIDSRLQLQGHALGKNDRWIAATASVTGTTLLTTDRDFHPLCPEFITREWVDPATGPAT